MDAWGVALIIATLALVVHDALSPRYGTILLAVAGAYWLGFAYNDFQDAPFDALDQEKGANNFFVKRCDRSPTGRPAPSGPRGWLHSPG